MLELPLILMAGVLGSSHCIGMCGPFALALAGGSKSWHHNLARQLLYTFGRACTYGVLGAGAGFGGLRLARSAPWLTDASALFAILAGGWLLYQGLTATGLWRSRAATSGQPCLASDLFRSMLRLPGWTGVFIAGLFTGLMPCGLVYGFLALAAATSSVWLGAATMATFGLGTAPVMVAAGCGGSLFTLTARRQVFRIAAWCLVLTGAISIARGMSFLGTHANSTTPICPFCSEADSVNAL